MSCGALQRESQVPITPLGAESVNWGPCPEALGGARIDCTQVEVPANWDKEKGSVTSVLLRRRATKEKSRGSLWALDGGPGFAGDGFFEPNLADLVDSSGLDLYVPSHRGSIGQSSLQCPSAQETFVLPAADACSQKSGKNV